MSAAGSYRIWPQPDDTTCGPTCLHSIYHHWKDPIALTQVIDEVRMLPGGGTLAVMLGTHALKRGYQATIYNYNLQLFDPTWYPLDNTAIRAKMAAQLQVKASERIKFATAAYDDFLRYGGKLKQEDLRPELFRQYLTRGIPILTGVSATYLYNSAREYGVNPVYDDVLGEPGGHFIVVPYYDNLRKRVGIADPLHINPISESPYYEVTIPRLVTSILLGVLTYDAVLLMISPRDQDAARMEEE